MNYDRAIRFFVWLTETVYTNDAFRNVGMFGLLNEGLRGSRKTESMNAYYYPKAYEVNSLFQHCEKTLFSGTNLDVGYSRSRSEAWSEGDRPAPCSVHERAMGIRKSDSESPKWIFLGL